MTTTEPLAPAQLSVVEPCLTTESSETRKLPLRNRAGRINSSPFLLKLALMGLPRHANQVLLLYSEGYAPRFFNTPEGLAGVVRRCYGHPLVLEGHIH